jgi:ribose transport system substrate-binding protein
MIQRFARNSGYVKALVAGAMLLTSTAVLISTSSASSKPKTIKNCTVGFSDPTSGNTYLANSEAGAAAVLSRHGCKLVTLEADYSVTTEISNIQTFMTEKVKALIIWPEETSADTSALTKAAKSGISIIGYSAYPKTPASTAPPTPFTGQYLDAHASISFIKQRFEYLKAHLPGGKGEVAYIGFGEPVAELEQDYTLTMQVAKEFPTIKVVERVNDATDDIAGAVSPAAAVLTKYPKLAAFLCYNDPSAIGAASAVKAAGRSGKVLILGEELDKPGVSAIKSGEIGASWDFSAYSAAGADLGTLAWEAINHNAAAKTTIIGPFTMYNKANISTLSATELSHL